jgi:hypothetical protein
LCSTDEGRAAPDGTAPGPFGIGCGDSDDQEIGIGDGKSGHEEGELHGTAGANAVAVVEQLARVGFVDDAIVGILIAAVPAVVVVDIISTSRPVRT